jgi:phosphate/sulfate permease
MPSHKGDPRSIQHKAKSGPSMGVALMNYDLGAVNWKQLGFIFGGWVLTLPCAGLINIIICEIIIK